MSSLISVLRSAWRRPKQPLVRLPQNSVKLYEHTPPAWARWALVLVSVDVMVATSAVDIIWNAWTMPDPSLPKPEENDTKAAALNKSTDNNMWRVLQVIPPGHILVPEWKRVLSGTVFIISGIIVAASVLAARSRVVRCVSYVRPSKEMPGVPPSICLQAASHPMKSGALYAIKDCRLRPSNENHLLLEIKGQGKWVIDVRGAKIADKLAPEDRTLARSTMLKAWKDVDGSTR